MRRSIPILISALCTLIVAITIYSWPLGIKLIVCSFVGWVTNKIAIYMVLFEVRIFGIKIPGTGLIRLYKNEIRQYVVEHYDKYIWPAISATLDGAWTKFADAVTLSIGLLLCRTERVKKLLKMYSKEKLQAFLDTLDFELITKALYKGCKHTIRLIEVYGAVIGLIVGLITSIFW